LGKKSSASQSDSTEYQVAKKYFRKNVQGQIGKILRERYGLFKKKSSTSSGQPDSPQLSNFTYVGPLTELSHQNSLRKRYQPTMKHVRESLDEEDIWTESSLVD